MGIPIGWNIKRDQPKDKDPLRADLTGHRSPIRRRVRPNRSPRPHSALDTEFLISAPGAATHIEWIPRSSHRSRLAPPPVPEVSRSDYHRSTTDAATAAGNPPPPLSPVSTLRRSRNRLDEFIRTYGTRRALETERSLAGFTPGFAPAAASRSSGADTAHDARDASRIRERASYRRAAHPRMTRSRSPRADRYAARSDDTTPDEEHESSDNNNNNNPVAFPPLRRMGRRTIADGPLPPSSLRDLWSPAPALDGLGDRNRSVSPFDDQLNWDTFLTTVVDDPVAPTATSSFASAAASASFTNSHPGSRAGSSSNSASSSQTHLTVPSRRESPPQNDQFLRACDTSDNDTASDTEEEEETEVRVPMRRPHTERSADGYGLSNSTAPRRRMRPSYFSNEPPMRDAERYSLRVLDRSRDASDYVHNFYNRANWRNTAPEEEEAQRSQMSQLDGPSDEPANTSEEETPPPLVRADSTPLDQELRDARSLLERLAHREDISDDFWASVGLTRSFADPVERFQELERL